MLEINFLRLLCFTAFYKLICFSKVVTSKVTMMKCCKTGNDTLA